MIIRYVVLTSHYLRTFWRSWIIVLTPLVLLAASWNETDGLESSAARCGYVVAIMGVYWVTEALPLPITALIPMALFPALGKRY